MLKTTIYAVALGTFAFTSGASAVSLQIQSPAPKSSSISSDRLLAQYSFPRQYNRRPMRYPGQSSPKDPIIPLVGKTTLKVPQVDKITRKLLQVDKIILPVPQVDNRIATQLL